MLPAIQSLPQGIWVLEALLEPATCAEVLQRAAGKFRPARLHAAGRRNSEAFFSWPELRARLIERLHQRQVDYPMLGLTAAVIGPHLECYRYEAGDYVAPHTDARAPMGAGAASGFTLLVYLDSGAAGGETLFPEHDLKIQSVAGNALLFSQELLHAGAPVTAGRKHILRADVAITSPTPGSSLDAERIRPGAERPEPPDRRA